MASRMVGKDYRPWRDPPPEWRSLTPDEQYRIQSAVEEGRGLEGDDARLAALYAAEMLSRPLSRPRVAGAAIALLVGLVALSGVRNGAVFGTALASGAWFRIRSRRRRLESAVANGRVAEAIRSRADRPFVDAT